jgi:hypothetical protein
MTVAKEKRSSKFGIGIAVAVLIAGSLGIGMQLLGGRENGAAAPVGTNAFYTDDNKTFFKDSIDKLPPFDHNGKQAYRCDVFQGSDGKQFVGMVYRLTDAGRKEMESYLPRKKKDADGAVRRSIEEHGMQVKLVTAGEKAWEIADEATVTRMQMGMKDASGKPATLVVP